MTETKNTQDAAGDAPPPETGAAGEGLALPQDVAAMASEEDFSVSDGQTAIAGHAPSAPPDYASESEDSTAHNGAIANHDALQDEEFEAWGVLDEALLDPNQRAVGLTARCVGILLALTWVIPIGRQSGAPVNVWDTFGVADTLEVVRLVLPGVVGILFIIIGFFMRMTVKQKSTAMSAGLLALLVFGVNPFAILSVVTPPIDGRVAELMFGMVEGSYFPREDVTHLVLLGLGLGMFGVAGRYRSTVQTSPIGSYLLVAATFVLMAYYVWPYDSGRVPAVRNATLYSEYHAFPDRLQAGVRAIENQLYQLDPEVIHSTHFRKLGRDVRLLGQVKLSAAYFAVIYFVPLLLILLALPSLKPSRYRNHRTVPARLVGWGASAYLLAFLFPLVLKESGKTTGDGFLAAARNYLLFAAIFLGSTVSFSAALREWLEPEQNNDCLPEDPLAWKES